MSSSGGRRMMKNHSSSSSSHHHGGRYEEELFRDRNEFSQTEEDDDDEFRIHPRNMNMNGYAPNNNNYHRGNVNGVGPSPETYSKREWDKSSAADHHHSFFANPPPPPPPRKSPTDFVGFATASSAAPPPPPPPPPRKSTPNHHNPSSSARMKEQAPAPSLQQLANDDDDIDQQLVKIASEGNPNWFLPPESFDHAPFPSIHNTKEDEDDDDDAETTTTTTTDDEDKPSSDNSAAKKKKGGFGLKKLFRSSTKKNAAASRSAEVKVDKSKLTTHASSSSATFSPIFTSSQQAPTQPSYTDTVQQLFQEQQQQQPSFTSTSKDAFADAFVTLTPRRYEEFGVKSQEEEEEDDVSEMTNPTYASKQQRVVDEAKQQWFPFETNFFPAEDPPLAHMVSSDDDDDDDDDGARPRNRGSLDQATTQPPTYEDVLTSMDANNETTTNNNPSLEAAALDVIHRRAHRDQHEPDLTKPSTPLNHNKPLSTPVTRYPSQPSQSDAMDIEKELSDNRQYLSQVYEDQQQQDEDEESLEEPAVAVAAAYVQQRDPHQFLKNQRLFMNQVYDQEPQPQDAPPFPTNQRRQPSTQQRDNPNRPKPQQPQDNHNDNDSAYWKQKQMKNRLASYNKNNKKEPLNTRPPPTNDPPSKPVAPVTAPTPTSAPAPTPTSGRDDDSAFLSHILKDEPPKTSTTAKFTKKHRRPRPIPTKELPKQQPQSQHQPQLLLQNEPAAKPTMIQQMARERRSKRSQKRSAAPTAISIPPHEQEEEPEELVEHAESVYSNNSNSQQESPVDEGTAGVAYYPSSRKVNIRRFPSSNANLYDDDLTYASDTSKVTANSSITAASTYTVEAPTPVKRPLRTLGSRTGTPKASTTQIRKVNKVAVPPIQVRRRPQQEPSPSNKHKPASTLLASAVRLSKRNSPTHQSHHSNLKVQRPRKGTIVATHTPSPKFDTDDPIQRAGLRLLSAAAVPIQTEVRRFLARCRAQDRMWAIIIIQSYFRRWLAEVHRYEAIYAAMLIQSNFRGWLVRDNLEDEHYCAVQIQRIARGYLATMSVYEDLYNITVIQSLVRRRFACKEAAIRMYCLIQIQSMGRMLYQRNQYRKQKACAIRIQALWRTYSAQMNFQFDIVDIIIVQSIVRRRAAIHRFKALLHQKRTRAATKIQTIWRSHDSVMNFHATLCDIMIVQSTVRRWLAIRDVQQIRHDLQMQAATRIQASWRGFMAYTDYLFTIADIIIVQRTVRKWSATRYVQTLRQQHQEQKENQAAVVIQKTWRGHYCYMNMIFTLVHIIIVQSVVRRFLARKQFDRDYELHAAQRTIAAAWRGLGVRSA